MRQINHFFKRCKPALWAYAFGMLSHLSYAQQWGNYTLVAVQNQTSASLVDTNGTTFKTWSGLTGGGTGYSSYILPGGKLLRTVKVAGTSISGGGITGGVQIIDYNGTLLWNYTHTSSTYCLHHDVCPLPNGNILMISYEIKTAAEASAAGSSQNIAIQSEKIIEVKPNGLTGGDIVWEWHVWDHLVQNLYVSKANYQTSIVQHPELLNINYKTSKDWLHMNGIDYNPVLDQIVVSSHYLNEMYVIDHSTTTAEAASHAGGNAGKGGDILYRWGNPAAYGATGSAVLNVVHDAHWIPEGAVNAGNLAAFNNGGTNTKSTADQITPPLKGYNYDLTLGAAYTPTSYTNRYVTTGKTSNMGSAQQLPNGNTLVCIALSGSIYEVNAAGTVLWSMTASGTTPQSSRYEKCYLNNAAPAIPTVSFASGKLSASNASSYQWYLNGKPIPNASSQTYTPQESGIYLVKTTDDDACIYQYSKGYGHTVVTDTKDAKYTSDVYISPNPNEGRFSIVGDFGNEAFKVQIFTVLGESLWQGSNQASFDLSTYPMGTYLVSVSSQKLGTKVYKVHVQK